MKANGWCSGWSSINRRARSLSILVLVQCSDLVKAGHSSIDAASRTRCETAREDIVCAPTVAGPDEIMSIARTFREKKLPCDALIYLGTDFTPSGWNTHNGEFTWNPKNFPNPKQMIDDLHAQHFKVVLHTVLESRHLTGTVN